MKSIFRYPGGKTKKGVQDRVLRVAPEFDEYREAFVGGGGIFFAIEPIQHRWINDFDEHLISVYQALQDRPEEFIKLCWEIAPWESEADDDRLRERFNALAFDDSADKALRFYFVNRTVWGGRVNYERRSRLYFSKPFGWTKNNLDLLPGVAEHLKGVKITQGDYSVPLLAPAENGRRVWVYCDPPYYKPELKSTSLLYRHNFERNEQHELFAERFFQSPHNVCVSYEEDDKGYVRSLFKGANIIEESWTYGGTWNPKSTAEVKDKKRKGNELLILNYEPLAMCR